jgi:valyl-tRNA synthetase
MSEELSKAYDPSGIEPKWARLWVERDLYRASNEPSSRPMFSIAIPPPNVTGSLHMGHMLEHTLIDAMVRWKRMRGHNVLWLPGTDHAGIATQVMVEREIATEGLTKEKLGREEFEKRVWAYKERNGGNIKKQMIRLGDSCDWSRERFTLDPGLSRAVREVFVSLYQRKLIYRGTYIINWCPRCMTALSDLEVNHDERNGSLWHIRYPIAGESGGGLRLDGAGAPDEYVVVATTRPETMLGDSAVAVNPADERYKKYHGRFAMLPLMNREIPFIIDELASMEFGTGAVKVTPAHDPNDYECGMRHNLPQIEVMDARAHMNDKAGSYKGLDRIEARKKIVSDLEHLGLLDKVEPYKVSLSVCQRCATPVEPRISTQWFVRIAPLAKRATEVVEREDDRAGHISFTPESSKREFLRWMENIRDWCISRQLWWGHRIPAWYCRNCGQTIVAVSTPEVCDKCGNQALEQDEDVLDTWFSSALWPFSTLGWTGEVTDTPDLRMFYPTSLMITGFDILFFWVARMVMFGLEFTGKVPFHDCYIHALVRNADRQKMSKTKGNVIDPLVVTEKYGTDAVRFTLALMASPGTDIVLSESRMESYRAFANKIWNAARFIDMKGEGVVAKPGHGFRPVAEVNGKVALEDSWMASRLNRVADQVENALEAYRFDQAAHVLYQFVWHEFCDWYIELAKLRNTAAAWRNLAAALENALRLLHPFMPFITEELWQRLTHSDGSQSISMQDYPRCDAMFLDDDAEKQMQALQEAIAQIRNARVEMKIDAKQEIDAEFYSENALLRARAEQYAGAFSGLARTALDVIDTPPSQEGGVLRHTPLFTVRIPYAGAVDAEAERARLTKDMAGLLKQQTSLESQLGNSEFLERAPKHVVAGMRVKLGENQIQQQKIKESLHSLGA